MPLPGWSTDWEVVCLIPVLTWAKYLESDISSKAQPWGTDCQVQSYVQPGRAACFPSPVSITMASLDSTFSGILIKPLGIVF